jgi:hypothetical protein
MLASEAGAGGAGCSTARRTPDLGFIDLAAIHLELQFVVGACVPSAVNDQAGNQRIVTAQAPDWQSKLKCFHSGA